MNKAELIEALSVHYDGSKTEAAKALNAVVQTITYKTAAGEKVSITGFGVFEKVHRSARMVRNPRTGERKKAEGHRSAAVPRRHRPQGVRLRRQEGAGDQPTSPRPRRRRRPSEPPPRRLAAKRS